MHCFERSAWQSLRHSLRPLPAWIVGVHPGRQPMDVVGSPHRATCTANEWGLPLMVFSIDMHTALDCSVPRRAAEQLGARVATVTQVAAPRARGSARPAHNWRRARTVAGMESTRQGFVTNLWQQLCMLQTPVLKRPASGRRPPGARSSPSGLSPGPGGEPLRHGCRLGASSRARQRCVGALAASGLSLSPSSVKAIANELVFAMPFGSSSAISMHSFQSPWFVEGRPRHHGVHRHYGRSPSQRGGSVVVEVAPCAFVWSKPAQ